MQRMFVCALVGLCMLALPAIAAETRHPSAPPPEMVQHRHTPNHPGPRPSHSAPPNHSHHAPPQHRPPHSHGPTGHPNYVRGGPRYNCGYTYRGVKYRHYCFAYGWSDWTRRYWHPRLGFYIYWCPGQMCWYQYNVTYQVYIPCDDLTNPNLGN